MPKPGAIRDGRKWNGRRWVPITPPTIPSTRVYNRRGRLISNTPVPNETADTNTPGNPPGPPVPLIKPRVADPLPTTLAGAYESLGPGAVGDQTWGRIIGRPNNTGFINADTKLTEEMLNQPGAMWNTNINTSIVPQAESVYNLMNTNRGIYNSVEGLPGGEGFNAIDLNTGIYDTPFPQSQPMTGLQVLRADDESKGLLYASGKYWAENADGKLEAIPTDLINGEGTAREQAIAFMQSKMQPIVGAIQNGDQQGVGNSTDVTATGFQSLELPGSGLPEFNRVSGTNSDGTSKTEAQIHGEFDQIYKESDKQSNTNLGLITVGPNTGLYIDPEGIENGIEKYDENRYYLKGNVDGNEPGLW